MSITGHFKSLFQTSYQVNTKKNGVLLEKLKHGCSVVLLFKTRAKKSKIPAAYHLLPQDVSSVRLSITQR